jgi:hypothetical protein
VTKKFFVNVCNNASYSACTYYASRRRKLLTPVNWLKKIAIKAESKEKYAKRG